MVIFASQSPFPFIFSLLAKNYLIPINESQKKDILFMKEIYSSRIWKDPDSYRTENIPLIKVSIIVAKKKGENLLDRWGERHLDVL